MTVINLFLSLDHIRRLLSLDHKGLFVVLRSHEPSVVLRSDTWEVIVMCHSSFDTSCLNVNIINEISIPKVIARRKATVLEV